MKNKKFYYFLLLFWLFLFIAVSFFIGFIFGRKDIGYYEQKNMTIVFPKHFPIYNTPIAEYDILLSTLNGHDYTLAEYVGDWFYFNTSDRAASRVPYTATREANPIGILLSESDDIRRNGPQEIVE